MRFEGLGKKKGEKNKTDPHTCVLQKHITKGNYALRKNVSVAPKCFLLNNAALCGKCIGDLLWLSLCRILYVFSAEQGRKRAPFGVQLTIWINHASSTWPHFFSAEYHTLLMEVFWFQYSYLFPGSERKALNAGVSSNKYRALNANKWPMVRY